jgi:hypothetical protein
MNADRWRMFALGGATLMFEVLLTRIAAVTLFANLAFAVIALSLFGLAVGSAWAERATFASEAARETAMRRALLAAAVFTLLSGLVATKLPLVPMELTQQGQVVTTFGARRSAFDDNPMQAHWGFIAIVTFAQAAPFALAGYVQALAFGRPNAVISRLYAFDLAGATLGSLASLGLLRWFGAVDALGVVSALFILAAAPGQLRISIPERIAGGLVVAASVLVLVLRPFDITYAAGYSEKGVIAVDWSALARIALLDNQLLVVDNTSATEVAFAHDGRFDDDLERIPYLLRATGDVLVIGAGGGQEIETALATAPDRKRRVDAVELADGEERLMRAKYGKQANFLLDQPGVHYQIADGRSFLETSSRSWDVIQMKEVNFHSFAGQAASAWSPNLLFTVEAFRLQLAHVTANGFMALTKGLYASNDVAPTEEILAALHGAIPELADHLIMVDRMRPSGRQRLFLVGKLPIGDDERAEIGVLTKKLGLHLVAPEPFADVIHGQSPVRPPTDDHPFGQGARQRSDHQMLRIGVIVIGILSTLLLMWSLFRVEAPRRKMAAEQLGLCAVLGIGFMFLEVVLVERTSLLLGHPTIAFAVVITALLCALGAGSMLAHRLTRPIAMATFLAVIALSLGPEFAAGVLRYLPLPVRAVILGLGLFSCAIPLGMLLPYTIRVARETNAATPAACWSLNAACSVFGTLAAAMFVRTNGFQATTRLTWTLYAFAIVLWLWLETTPQQRDPQPAE